MNLKDVEEFKSRDLTFIAYGVQPYVTDSWLHDMKLLSDTGIESITLSDYSMFPNDGKVVRVDSNSIFESLATHHTTLCGRLLLRKTGRSYY